MLSTWRMSQMWAYRERRWHMTCMPVQAVDMEDEPDVGI